MAVSSGVRRLKSNKASGASARQEKIIPGVGTVGRTSKKKIKRK